nr:tryptophan-rich sensory protein [Actinomadura bangladeshensis]
MGGRTCPAAGAGTATPGTGHQPGSQPAAERRLEPAVLRPAQTKAGLAGTVLLDLGNADLIRRTTAVDTTAAGALAPYAAWCTFATALNADIARRNR